MRDWIDSFHDLLERSGPERAQQILRELQIHAAHAGVTMPFSANTPYINTIPADEQPPYPGNREIERRIKSIIRWNAMAMVVRANREEAGIGGHISTYASAATLYEVGFNHFFRGRTRQASRRHGLLPGPRLAGHLRARFPRGPALRSSRSTTSATSCTSKPGLSSYPHPWLMPDFWQFPTVSMGLGPIMAIYHARFIRYLEDRGLKEPSDQKVWAFLGDGETDEPEDARRDHARLAREARQPDLRHQLQPPAARRPRARQRQDHPGARGRSSAAPAGTSSRSIWGADWDPLLAKDKDGLLVQAHGRGRGRRVPEIRRRERRLHPQAISSASIRELLEMVEPSLRRAAPEDAARRARPGEGLRRLQGRDGQQGLADRHPREDDQGLRAGRERRGQEHHAPAEEAERGGAARVPLAVRHPDLRRGHRQGPVLPPARGQPGDAVPAGAARGAGRLPARAQADHGRRRRRRRDDLFQEFLEGTGDREVSTTMAFVRILAKLLRDPEIGKLIVPIVPDEARTFGMEALFRQCGIYSHPGQLYEPVDKPTACSTTRKRGTARSSRRASTRPARCRRSSPPARPTRTTGSTRSRSSSSTPCSASSASAT